MNSLRIYVSAACLLALVSVWLLPLPLGTRLFITVVLVFAGIFVFVDSTRRGRTFAAITVALLALYLALTLQRGAMMLATGTLAGILLGLGMVVLPLIGAWALVREVLFGIRVQELGRILGEEGGLPVDDLPRTPSGGIVREAADEAFGRYRQEVEDSPEDWRSWFRLSCAYDAAGDRKRARRSMRDAVALHRGRAAGALAQGERSR